MKVYKFIFIIGILNIFVPFLGFPTTVKQTAFIFLGIVTVLYALIVRAVEKEKENGISPHSDNVSKEKHQSNETRKIEDVVEMHEEIFEKKVVSDVTPKRRGRKPKVLAQENNYE